MSTALALGVRDVRVVEGAKSEPRVLDLRLAERLGFKAPRQIRELIERNHEELERYGHVVQYDVVRPQGGGTPAREYWLNEAQALLLCMKSETDAAADVRAELIAVFLAWRHGQRGDAPVTIAMLREVVRVEVVQPVLFRLDELVCRLNDQRREIPQSVKSEHIRTSARLGGRCPCCSIRPVINPDGTKGLAEFDHHRRSNAADADATWLICKRCHDDLTRGITSREHVEPFFQAYQCRRRASDNTTCAPGLVPAFEPVHHNWKQTEFDW